eukprot:PhF_6_TR25703/c0_g1_i1/m.36228
MTSLLNDMWLVADMDGTIAAAPHRVGGAFPLLKESPCHGPIHDWLRRGGRLAVLTTAGPRTVNQVWTCLPPELRSDRRVVIGAYSGSSLCYGDSEGNLVEDVLYRKECRTCLPHDTVDRLIHLCRDKVLEFLRDAAKDPTLISLLSTKYHEPYRKLAAMSTEERESLMTIERCTTKGYFISIPQEDTLIDVQRLFTDETEIGQLTVMGIPITKFHHYFPDDVISSIESHGVYIKSQPNSVCIGMQGVAKDLAVRWLEKTPEYKFSRTNAIAIADTPEGPDKPLTQLPPMPFVSVAPTNKFNWDMFVGQEEIGTAKWMEKVLSLADPTSVVKDAEALKESIKAVAKL